MITLITGAPGSGKTAACVNLLTVFGKEGRAIFVDGIPDLKVPHVTLEHPWHESVPDGSVIVIDEVQRVWRPTAAGAKVTPEIEALETHRHKGIEFILMTQHPNLLHSNVRRLVGRHVHIRDNGVLGRWWYEWPEAANPEQWKSAPVKVRYRLPKHTFKKYTSASLHVKSIRKVPVAVIVLVVAFAFAGYMGITVYNRINAKVNPDPVKLAGKSEAVKNEVVEKAESKRRSLPVDEALALAASVPPKRAKLVGCIHAGSRCECLDEEGFSATVELKLCLDTASRGGLAVPYDIRPVEAKQPRQTAVAADRPKRDAEVIN
jgi:zona occludens toxin